MAKIDYIVLQGIDYPPNKRAEAGQIVSDLPKDSIPWLLESGIIERAGAAPKVAFVADAVDGDEFVQDGTNMERLITAKTSEPLEDKVTTMQEEDSDEL
jgi:hypothetical protein